MNDRCDCDLRHRQWNPGTGRCETCGQRFPPKVSDPTPTPSSSEWAKEAGRCCWFIERGGGEWWTGDGRLPWSRDPNKAVRFCRREDADAVISGRDLSLPAWRDCNPFASEHEFVDMPRHAAPIISAKDAQIEDLKQRLETQGQNFDNLAAARHRDVMAMADYEAQIAALTEQLREAREEIDGLASDSRRMMNEGL